jgi:Na+/H+ antiporter NhaD/arsenite permease-like protein
MVRIIVFALICVAALIFVLWLLFNTRQKPWNEMTDEEKKKKKIKLFSGIAVFLTSLIALIVTGKNRNT